MSDRNELNGEQINLQISDIDKKIMQDIIQKTRVVLKKNGYVQHSKFLYVDGPSQQSVMVFDLVAQAMKNCNVTRLQRAVVSIEIEDL